MRSLILVTILLAVCSIGSSAIIGHDSPEQELFVLEQKINILYNRLDSLCPQYVRKREVGPKGTALAHIDIAKELYNKLIVKYIACKNERSKVTVQQLHNTTTDPTNVTAKPANILSIYNYKIPKRTSSTDSKALSAYKTGMVKTLEDFLKNQRNETHKIDKVNCTAQSVTDYECEVVSSIRPKQKRELVNSLPSGLLDHINKHLISNSSKEANKTKTPITPVKYYRKQLKDYRRFNRTQASVVPDEINGGFKVSTSAVP